MSSYFFADYFLTLNDNPGIPKVENMGRNDQNKGKRQQNQLIIMPILLCKQKKDTSRKQQERYRTPVMRPESVPQGQDSNQKCQSDHAGFKPEIVDDVDAENGKT